jgi:hypothetical protein
MVLILILVLALIGGWLAFAPSARSLGAGRIAGLVVILLIALLVVFALLLDRLN